MNLLEHYINKVISVEDVTDKYIERMMKYYDDKEDLEGLSDFLNNILGDKIYEVVINTDCYGVRETVKLFWRKSEYETNISRGYYLA